MQTQTRNLVNRALDYAVECALNPLAPKPSIKFFINYSGDEDLVSDLMQTYGITVRQRDTDWLATMQTAVESGPTREIAVCQCLVASQIGETIDIPDELLF